MAKKTAAKPVSILAPLVDELGALDEDIRKLRLFEKRAEMIKAEIKRHFEGLAPHEAATVEGKAFAVDLSMMGPRRVFDPAKVYRVLNARLFDCAQWSIEKVSDLLSFTQRRKLITIESVGPRTITVRPLSKEAA
jgi:hypothetical protein